MFLNLKRKITTFSATFWGMFREKFNSVNIFVFKRLKLFVKMIFLKNVYHLVVISIRHYTRESLLKNIIVTII